MQEVRVQSLIWEDLLEEEIAIHSSILAWEIPWTENPGGLYMSESESEVPQSCPTLCYPMDCSLSGSSVHGIFQAEVLEWGAIAFSILGS